jgi:hypothetical protein
MYKLENTYLGRHLICHILYERIEYVYILR